MLDHSFWSPPHQTYSIAESAELLTESGTYVFCFALTMFVWICDSMQLIYVCVCLSSILDLYYLEAYQRIKSCIL